MKAILLCLLLSSQAALSQQVGDTLPASLMESIINRALPGKEGSVAGKYILLDFWGTQCGSCVQGMPKVLEIQQQFPEDVLIIYAAREDSLAVHRFFDKRPAARKFKLPFVTDATDLAAAFPFTGIPHIIWIGPDRVIKAITGSPEFTAAHVGALVRDGVIDLPVKEDPLDIDFNRPLLQQETIDERHVLQSSVLIEGIKRMRSQISTHALAGSRTKVIAMQVPLRSMYANFYRFAIRVHPYEMSARILGAPDVQPYLALDRCYSFEAIFSLPEGTPQKQAVHRARQQLDQQLGFQSSLVDTMLACYILQSLTPSSSRIDSSYTQDLLDEIYFHRQPLSHVARYIASHYWPDKLIRVAEGCDPLVTIRLSKRNRNFRDLPALLQTQGLFISDGKTKEKIIYLQKDPS